MARRRRRPAVWLRNILMRSHVAGRNGQLLFEELLSDAPNDLAPGGVAMPPV